MEKKKRVVVTGLGVVSCFGNDVDQFHEALVSGKSGVTPITTFPCDELSTRFAASVKDFDPGIYMEKKQARRVDPYIAFAIVAGKKALESAGINSEAQDALDKKKCGVLIGSGMGGMSVFVEGVSTFNEKGEKRVSPFFIPYILTNMAGAMLSMDLGFMGPNYSISTACATSNYAIISAANHIQNGDADLMIAGGSEAAVIPMGLAGFAACRALSQRNDEPQKASRPWDKNRDGFVMGEGAGVLVLESLEHALARGAPIIAEYLGGAISSDAHHITEPRSDGEGVAFCVSSALENAGVLPHQVDYINAHGTSTPVGDMAEIRALKKVFSNPSAIKMNSTKSMIGHLLGAAGGVEAIATIKAITTGWIHPTLNLEEPEEDLGFDISSKASQREIKIALSNSFGFGGHNATVVFAPYQ